MNKTLLHKIATQRREVRIQSALRKIAADIIDMEWNPQAGYWQAGTGATSAAAIQPRARAAAGLPVGKPAGFNFFGGYGGSMIGDALGIGRSLGRGIDSAFGIEDSAPIFTGAGQFADSIGGWMLGQRYLTGQNLKRGARGLYMAARRPLQTGRALVTGARMVGRGAKQGYQAVRPAIQPAMNAVKTGGSKFMLWAKRALPYVLRAVRRGR